MARSVDMFREMVVRRNPHIALALVAVVAALSGCQKKVGGQVAATVNGEEITQIQLNGALRGVSPAALTNAKDKQAAINGVLQQLVDRQILVQQAKADGVDKQPEYAVELQKLQDELTIRMLAAKVAQDIPKADDGAVVKFIGDNPQMFAARQLYALDQIGFPIPKDKAVLTALQPAHTLDAIIAVLNANHITFNRGKGQLDSATLPPEVIKHIASLPAGEPLIMPQNGQVVVAVVTGTSAAPVGDEQAKGIATNMLREKAVREAMDARLNQGRLTAKVSYGPGFAAPAKTDKK